MNRSPETTGRRRSRWRTGLIALASSALLVLTSVTGSAAAADYTQSATSLSATEARISFTPTTAAVYVDVHYLVNGANQQNFRMTNNSGTWTQTVGSLSSGNVVDYWFTYEKSGPQYDTPHFSYTHSGGSSTVATPSFSPAGGTYSTAQSVTISTATSGATIRYTTDGSTPTTSSTVYNGAISVSSNTTLKAIGVKSGSTTSAVATAAYVIGTPVATPTFSPAGGQYSSAQTVTISTATSGSTIRYTTDGSQPTASSTLYSGPISVPSTRTINAIGIKSGLANSAVASATYTIGTSAGCPTQSDTPNFGPNVRIFDPSMSATSIQSQLDSDFNSLKDTLTAQMSDRRVAHLFKPGSYSVHDDVGYYTSVAGLGQNPGDVVINGAITVDAFNESDQGVALQNFWRSAENMAVNPIGGSNRWAVAQAAPFRRMDIRGNLQLYPASYGFASGGYIADTKVSGQTASISQQQWYTRDSNLGSWAGGVWNMVFSGTPGAPATTFPNPPETTLGTTPVSRDVPYLYVDSAGKYRVFTPSLRTNASGASWANGSTPGTSIPMSQFYVVKSGDTASSINSALAAGCNLFFTPGVYHVNQTLNVTKANTVVLGVGYPTIIPDNGVNAMQVADVDGVRIKGVLFDAGTTNSAALLTVGPSGSSAGHAGNPTTLQDVFFRMCIRDRHLGLARRPRQRGDVGVDAGQGGHRADRQRQRRAGHRPVRRALPEVPGHLERPGRQDHLLPERDALRRAEPGELDESQRPQRVRGLQGRRQRDLARGVGVGQLQLLQRQPLGERLPRVRGAQQLERALPQPVHGLVELPGPDHPRHQRHRRRHASGHRPGERGQLPVT